MSPLPTEKLLTLLILYNYFHSTPIFRQTLCQNQERTHKKPKFYFLFLDVLFHSAHKTAPHGSRTLYCHLGTTNCQHCQFSKIMCHFDTKRPILANKSQNQALIHACFSIFCYLCTHISIMALWYTNSESRISYHSRKKLLSVSKHQKTISSKTLCWSP